MSDHQPTPRAFMAAAGSVALGLTLVACGGSGPAKPQSTTSAPSSPAAGSSAASSAQSQIAKNWEAFFSGKTSFAKSLSLLQDGSAFRSALRAQSTSSLAKEASVKVTKVTVVSPSKADVTYTILLSGSPVLPNQKGEAVKENGTWKVGVASFCGLLKLENGGTSGLPSACKSAG